MDSGYRLINMPLILSREVERRDPEDPQKWIRDDQWYADTEEAYRRFLEFLAESGFLKNSTVVLERGIQNAVVTRGDLTDEGFGFLRYALDKWLSYFEKDKRKEALEGENKLRSLQKKFEQSQR